MPYRILLSDSHPVVHQGVRFAFSQEPDLEIIATVTEGSQLADAVQQHQPNVLITDVRLNDKDALNTLEKVVLAQQGLVVIVFSHHEDTFNVARCCALGCYDYIFKSSSCSQLVETVKNGIRGVPASPQSLLNRTRIRMKSKRPQLDEQGPLTQREMQVIRHISMGLKNREIGLSLEISVETVKEHVQNILRKLSVNDRTQAAVWAVRGGYI